MALSLAVRWPTPTAQGMLGGQTMPPGTNAVGATPDGRRIQVGLLTAVLWPTPNVSDCNGARTSEQVAAIQDGSATRETSGGPAGCSQLREAVLWPTPLTANRTSDKAKYGRPTSGPSRGGASFGLEDAVAMWPTPTATPYGSGQNGCPHDGRSEYAGRGAASLETLVRSEHWPTPGAADGQQVTRHQGGNPSLTGAVLWPTPTGRKRERGPALPDQLKVRGGSALNPRWVEALMGFPLGWTEPSPTDGLPVAAKRNTRGNRRGPSQAANLTGGPDSAP